MTNTKQDKQILTNVLPEDPLKADDYNIRKNGESIIKKSNPYIEIIVTLEFLPI